MAEATISGDWRRRSHQALVKYLGGLFQVRGQEFEVFTGSELYGVHWVAWMIEFDVGVC